MINSDKELLYNIIGTTRLKPNILKIYHDNKDIYNYIHTRYNDTVSTDDNELFYEVYYRIKNNIDTVPLCPVCDNKVRFVHTGNKYFYGKTCYCKVCYYKYIKHKRDNTVYEKYGVSNPYQIPVVKNNIRHKIISRYGGFTLEKQSSLYNKYKETMLLRYNTDIPMYNKHIVNKLHGIFYKKYGVVNPWSNKDIIYKCQQTQKKNGTFRKSSEEDECYRLLCDKYGTDNVIRQYKSDLYPYKCDLYIIQTDTYIEYNGFFTHNNHLYNKNNIKDIILKCKWLNKAKLKPIYYNAVNTWTIKDVEKYKTAKKNKLNYLIFYNMKEFNEWYNNM